MSRLAIVLALTATPVATSGPTQDPPSSLRPTAVPGKLRLAHNHQRVQACHARSTDAETICDADTEPDLAGTSLTLRPLDGDGKTTDDARAPVDVTFDNVPGRVELTREIGAGLWEVGWSGLDGKHRFGIAEGESLRINLATTTGVCVRERQRCVLKASKVVRAVEIPETHRVD